MKLLFIFSALFLISCNNKRPCEKITFNKVQLDSVKATTDTSYSKPYRSDEFAEAEYHINRSDSSVCQLMKDTAGTIRQVIMTRKGIRFFSAEYLANGQLKAKMDFDVDGKFDGPGTYYYENGCIRSKGNFQHGFYVGEWKNYNEKGKLVSTDIYDSNGQIIKTVISQ